MTLWRGAKPLILASQSRTRQQLLTDAGLAFSVSPAPIDERALAAEAARTSASEIAALLARAKAISVSKLHNDHYVIGADQTLALGERLFHKPANRGAAAEQLQVLSGRTHHLHSAVAVALNGEIQYEVVASAAMTMRLLEPRDIDAYLAFAGDRVTRSVGAYQLEGPGVHLFDRIDGDYFTILGLPMLPLLKFLRDAQLLAV